MRCWSITALPNCYLCIAFFTILTFSLDLCLSVLIWDWIFTGDYNETQCLLSWVLLWRFCIERSDRKGSWRIGEMALVASLDQTIHFCILLLILCDPCVSLRSIRMQWRYPASKEKSVLESCVSSAQCFVKKPSVIVFSLCSIAVHCFVILNSQNGLFASLSPVITSARMMTSSKTRKLALCYVLFFFSSSLPCDSSV